MKTRAKIVLARYAYSVVSGARRIVGLGDKCRVVRHGIVYELDLSEGIDFSIFLLGSFELSTARALQRLIRPGMTVLDIGANIGAHTPPMAELVGPSGKVLAFEPTTYAFAKLGRNLALNPDLAGRVRAFQYFLASTPGAAVPEAIYSSWPLPSTAGAHPEHLGQPKDTTAAETHTLDEVLAREGIANIDLVKIDVDGFECEVLSGASTTLRSDRPIFVMELAPYVLRERGTSLDALLGLLLPLGYRFLDERTEAPLPESAAELEQTIAFGAGINTIARARG